MHYQKEDINSTSAPERSRTEFESLIDRLQLISSEYDSRATKIYQLMDNLIGQPTENNQQNAICSSSIPHDCFQGQLEDVILRLSKTGNEMDLMLDRLYNKI